MQGHTEPWKALRISLQLWRKTVPEEINLDYDADPVTTLAELIGVPGNTWYKVVSDESLWTEGVIKALFPNGTTLRLLDANFRQKDGMKLQAGRQRITYLQLSALLQLKLSKYYPG